MAPRLIFVARDMPASAFADNDTDLQGFEIHPIWRQAAFRRILFDSHLPFPDLAQPRYDYADVVYERMKPALRLATLFLRQVFPQMAKVRYAAIDNGVLSDDWQPTDANLQSFDQDLMRMRSEYFILLDYPNSPSVPDTLVEFGATCLFYNARQPPPLRKVYTQTGLSWDLMKWYTDDSWDTQPAINKCCTNFMMATTLLHELVHAVHAYRHLPLIEEEYHRNGGQNLTLNKEPKLSAGHRRELGFAIELELFGGIPASGDPGTPFEEKLSRRPSRLYLSTLNDYGFPDDGNPVGNASVFAFFDSSTWAQTPDEALFDYPLYLLSGFRTPEVLAPAHLRHHWPRPPVVVDPP